jgi:hypothetical protein
MPLGVGLYMRKVEPRTERPPPARAGANLDNDVLVVVGVARQELHAQLLHQPFFGLCRVISSRQVAQLGIAWASRARRAGPYLAAAG